MEKRLQISSSWADKGKEAVGDNGNRSDDPIDYWRREGNWPKKYFEQGDQTWLEELEANRSAKERWQKEEWYREQGVKMENHLLLRRKGSPASPWWKEAGLGSSTLPDLLREEKSAKYAKEEYEEDLKNRGNSRMYESDLDITDESKELCRSLLNSAQTTIQDSIFRDDRFRKACGKIQNQNEARVIQDIARLIVPSVETLTTCGATSLNYLVESVNEGWNKVIPITDTRPQPDYSVGFQESAFTDEQLRKLKALVGGTADLSRFMGTWRMYFPFLTCEVKCGAVPLDIADRQNAHSMTCAVKAVVELYRYVKWDKEFDWRKELNREMLGFSISHDDKMVRIYGHYPVFEGDKTAFYRHPIHIFDFRVSDGKEKWTAYKFTKNVYEKWTPKHLKRITKAIDAIPVDVNLRVPSASFPNTETETDSQEKAVMAMLQEEISWLKEQLAREREESKEQLARKREESKQRHAELMDQNQKQMAQNERQIAQNERQIEELMQLLDRERKE